ncbi:MAG: hypothetical protein DCC56_09535 [Anaerolineae bacterium]|nr:MAG: hypothetical protein DCC56_09535 [Anaerolineae bacterium]WKZ45170.1 MAG: hypothetical protein QY302_05205 [Anaerolineales bacterium]
MKNKILIVFFVLALALLVVPPVRAQETTPYVIRSTQPISDELKAHLDAWLATDAPSSAPYYIVTYVDALPDSWVVSLAGVNLESPDDDWLLEDGTTVWIGSVYVALNGEVTSFTLGRGMNKAPMKVFALPSLAPGGGSYVAFPFQAGTGMIYGVRAVHGAGDYGTSGMLAVDLLSGDDLGPGAAPPYAYASDAGTIDYICDDGTTVAVRTYNASTDDYFIYAHLLDNASIAISNSFTRGQQIGSIKYGSFDDDCGWAEQQEDHYHIHWMFEPANGAFQAEGCILRVSTKKWTCNNQEIGTGGWLIGGGGYGAGEDDYGYGSAEKSFWDYLVFGFVDIATNGWIKFLPTHQDFQYFYVLISTIRLMLRIMFVLVRANVNLVPIAQVVGYGIGINAFMSTIWIILAIAKAIKTNTLGA